MIINLKYILYIHLILYFIILLIFNANPIFFTFLGIISISFLVLILIVDFSNGSINIQTTRKKMFFLVILFLSFALSFLFTRDYLLITLTSIILYIYYFQRVNFKNTEFVNIINIFYLSYLFISILAYFGIISYPRTTTAEIIGFKETLLGIKGLVGFTGSTAHLDSFSVLISFLNLIFYKNKKNLILICISILGALATGSMTSIVLLIVIFLSYLLVRNSVVAASIMLAYTIIYLLILFALSLNTHIYIFGEDLYSFMNIATHGRSVIWEKMWIKMITNYEWYNYVLGLKDFDTVMQVPIWWSTGLTSNPHNSLLNIFFRFPFFFILGYIYFIFTVLKYFNYKLFCIVIIILVASLSNVEIIGIQNPIYFIILTYTLTNFIKLKKENRW